MSDMDEYEKNMEKWYSKVDYIGHVTFFYNSQHVILITETMNRQKNRKKNNNKKSNWIEVHKAAHCIRTGNEETILR
jgi:hypothetical protein